MDATQGSTENAATEPYAARDLTGKHVMHPLRHRSI